jgi:arginine repressor
MKTRRHSLILRLLDAHSVESHDQLAHLLAAEGIDVNQATLSRDLHALGVVKAPLPGGGSRYRSTPGPPDRSVALAGDDTVLAVVADGHLPGDVAAQIWGRVDESSAA